VSYEEETMSRSACVSYEEETMSRSACVSYEEETMSRSACLHAPSCDLAQSNNSHTHTQVRATRLTL
jgi:hypothetical protein